MHFNIDKQQQQKKHIQKQQTNKQKQIKSLEQNVLHVKEKDIFFISLNNCIILFN
jgi:hypothetical protein